VWSSLWYTRSSLSLLSTRQM